MSITADISNSAWVKQRLDAGDTVTAIAQAAGVSRQTASSWLKRHGLTATKRPYERPSTEQMAADYARHGSIQPMATEYEISKAVMRTWLFEAGIERNAPSPGAAPTPLDLEQVRRLRDNGATWATIAERFEVSAETLRRRFHAANNS